MVVFLKLFLVPLQLLLVVSDVNLLHLDLLADVENVEEGYALSDFQQDL